MWRPVFNHNEARDLHPNAGFGLFVARSLETSDTIGQYFGAPVHINVVQQKLKTYGEGIMSVLLLQLTQSSVRILEMVTDGNGTKQTA